MTLRIALAVLLTAASAAAQAPATWTAPRSGWLYVVSSDFDTGSGRLALIDPERGQVVASRPTGLETDLAVSRDGSRLYVSYMTAPHGTHFEVIDASNGVVLHRLDDGEPWPTMGSRYESRMALSADGRSLFRYKLGGGNENRTSYVETFDTVANRVLPERAKVPGCGSPAQLLPSLSEARKVFVVCSDTEDVRALTLNEQGGLAEPRPGRLRVAGGDPFTGRHPTAFFTAAGHLTVLKGDGRFAKVNAPSLQLVQQDAIDRVARRVPVPTELPEPPAQPASGPPNLADWMIGRQIWPQRAALAPDRSRVYVIAALGADTHARGDRVVALNADTFERVRTLRLRRAATSLAISANGAQLYAVDFRSSTMVVLDPETGREVRTIAGMPKRPVFAVVVP